MDIFYAIAEPTRRDIIVMLAQGIQLSASDIYSQFAVSHSAISQHLKVLKESNVVIMEKQAQHRMYSLNRDALIEVEFWAKDLTQLLDFRFKAMDELIAKEKLKQKK